HAHIFPEAKGACRAVLRPAPGRLPARYRGARCRPAALGGGASPVMDAVHGHQIRFPASATIAGTRIERVTIVSSRTPKATTKAIWARKSSGITHRAEKVAASTTPALVITPPVTATARGIPRRVPTAVASSRARVMRKIE